MDPKKPETLDLAVRDHVRIVAQELLAKSEMLKKAFDEGKLTIIEAYYSLETGEVTTLMETSCRWSPLSCALFAQVLTHRHLRVFEVK